MKQILVVDDNYLNCVMAKKALENDYHVHIVKSGQEALDFLAQNEVDLILMDIEMPKMNGIEAVKIIKADQHLSKIPVIFLTADSDPETEVECIACGADDFIRKPFVPVVMNTRISRVLEVYDLRKDLENQLEKRTHQMETATKKSLTDGLTGLHNRGSLEMNLDKLLSEGASGSFFMIDLDNFKKINDEHGHIIGDKTLQIFADTLKEFSGENDIICRLAGDEFVTFYPNQTDRELISKKAEGIITTFTRKMDEIEYGGIVSVSIGIIITNGDEDYATLYHKGDKSLYHVKNNGKNAYHIYGENEDEINEVSTVVDMEYINNLMQKGLTEKRGPFSLAYDEFKKIYDFVTRHMVRSNNPAQLVLFTINVVNPRMKNSIENIMEEWEKSLVDALRIADTGTRYSSSQYMMIFMDVDKEQGEVIAQRVIDNFFKNNSSLKSDIKIIFNVQTMENR